MCFFAQVEKCSLKLDRAHELISGLGGEKERWMEAAHILRGQFGGIIGDMLVSVLCVCVWLCGFGECWGSLTLGTPCTQAVPACVCLCVGI